MKRLCDDHRAELGVEYVGDLDRQGACVVCDMKARLSAISDLLPYVVRHIQCGSSGSAWSAVRQIRDALDAARTNEGE